MADFNVAEFKAMRRAFAAWMDAKGNPARRLIRELALASGASEGSITAAFEGVALSTWVKEVRIYSDGAIYKVGAPKKNDADFAMSRDLG